MGQLYRAGLAGWRGRSGGSGRCTQICIVTMFQTVCVCLCVTINPFAVAADEGKREQRGAGSKTPSGQVSAICMLQYANERLLDWKAT